MDRPFLAPAVTLLRRNRLIAAAPLGVVLFPLLLLVARWGHLGLLAGLAPLALLVGVLGTLFGRSTNRYPTPVVGGLTASSGGLFFDGELLARRDQIRAGFVTPRPGAPPLVRIEHGIGAPIEFCMDDEAEARELLRALGLDASQTVARFKLPPMAVSRTRTRVLFGASIAAIALLLGLVQGALAHSYHLRNLGLVMLCARLLLLGGAVAVSMLLRTTLTVGADGLLTSWLGQKRFLAYRDIVSIEPYLEANSLSRYKYHGVALGTAEGEVIRIPIAATRAIDAQDRVNIVLSRIREAMEAQERGDPMADAARLHRGSRDVADWIRALRAMGTGADHDHRTAPVEPETLWRIVADPGAQDAERAGAAVALSGSLDDTGRSRLRALAQATASPRVRVALEAASSDSDDEALAEVLAELEQEPAPARVSPPE